MSIRVTQVAKRVAAPRVMALSTDTRPPCMESEKSGASHSRVYTNKYDETVCYFLPFQFLPCFVVQINCLSDSGLMQIVFDQECHTPGYVFVPAGNNFVTRRCRKLTKESGRSVYAVYVRGLISVYASLFGKLSDQTQKKQGTSIGLHVPEDVFRVVESDFKIFQANKRKNLSRRLQDAYPNMPPEDKEEIHLLHLQISSGHPVTTAIPINSLIMRSYVRDRYTPFKSLKEHHTHDREAFSQVDKRVNKIIAFWRGKTEYLESYRHISSHRPVGISTFGHQ